MEKRISFFSTILTFFILLSLMLVPAEAVVVNSGVCGENLTWELDYMGTFTISGVGDMYDYEKYGAPWFSERGKIKKLVLNEGITSIGDYAFYDCGLIAGEMILPDSIDSIGNSAFERCFGFVGEINISANISEIGQSAFGSLHNITQFSVDINNKDYSSKDGVLFDKNQLILIAYPAGNTRTEYIVPDNVTTIADSAFGSCAKLESIIIPDSVTTIADSAFGSCAKLENIIIPDSVVEVGDDVFFGTAFYKNKDNWVDGGLYIGDVLIDCSGYDKSFYVKTGTRIIAARAFSSFDDICQIYIPDSVEIINSRAFYGSGFIEAINVSSDNKYFSSDEYGTLFNKEKSVLLYCPSVTGSYSNWDYFDYIVPDSVTSIGDYAFYQSYNYFARYRSITISKNVADIGYLALNCYGISNIYVDEENVNFSSDDGVLFNKDKTELIAWPQSRSSGRYSDSTFYAIPSSTISIAECAFYNFEYLNDIFIPRSVTKIGKNAFVKESYPATSIPRLRYIYYEGSQAEWDAVQILEGNDDFLSGKVFCNACTISFSDKHLVIDSTVVLPTCTEKGYTINTCICGYVYSDNEVMEKEHNYILQNSVVSNCITHGVDTYVCENDSSHIKVENFDKNPFNHENTKFVDEVQSTCSATGYLVGIYCNDCQQYISGHAETAINPSNHVNTKNVPETPATFETVGYTAGVYCNDCKKYISGHAEIPKFENIGDIDGDGQITATDARLALRAAVGLESFNDVQKKVSDADGDGQITASDARLILRAAVGLEELKKRSK